MFSNGYNQEMYRRRSFDDSWRGVVSPGDLTRSGFITLVHVHTTMCFFCRLNLLHWVEQDDAMSEHWRHAPG